MLREIQVRRVRRSEEARFQELMRAQHYLGSLPKIGETIWYVATWLQEWVALLSFSAAALKCAARDRWIGWSHRQQYARLSLVANNTRYCILDPWRRHNLASRVLGLCEHRLCQDWVDTFGHPLLLLETFVDPQRHRGTLYLAANWVYVGDTLGFRRRQGGYSDQVHSPKKVFLRSLHPQARTLLCQGELPGSYQPGVHKLMLTADQMRALPEFFKDIPDPRQKAGRRHPLHVVLALAAAAMLCGARGYKHIAEWAERLSQDARRRFVCRLSRGQCEVPSYHVFYEVLRNVDPEHLDRALQRWNAQIAPQDQSLALDGKAMRGAVQEDGSKVHILSAVGHESGVTYAQKK
jgi:Domain of unknown function (DUF4338)/DDE_Tnp_1-associated